MDAQAELNRLADFGPATTVEPATGQWEIKAHSGEPGPPSDDERDALAAPANRGAPPVTVAEYGKSGERRRDPSGTITRISAPGSADLSLPSLRGRRARWRAQLPHVSVQAPIHRSESPAGLVRTTSSQDVRGRTHNGLLLKTANALDGREGRAAVVVSTLTSLVVATPRN